jgi:integrase
MPANIISFREQADKPTKRNPRAEARQHLEAALETGVRGALRDAIQAALDIAAAPRRRELTDLQYEALRPGQKLVDPHRPGFIAKATGRGVRFVYRHNAADTGKRTETTIGLFRTDATADAKDAITLSEARQRWADMRARRMRGLPANDTAATTAPPALTIKKLVEKYLSEYAERVKRSWKDDERLLNKHLLPIYGDLPATKLTAEQVQALLAALADTPREVQKLRAAMQTLFNVAVGKTRKVTLAETWLPRGHPNPVSNVQVAQHKPTVYEPTDSEIRVYYRSLANNGADLRLDVRDVLLLQLLTACRINEVVGTAWQEFDLDHGKWRIPSERMKAGFAHTVLLSKQALALLKRRQDSAASDFVFPSPTNHKRPIRAETVQKSLADSREVLGLGNRFTSHSVRHAFTSWAAEQGAALEVRNRCTAHVIANGIDARYNHAQLNTPAAELWQAWADRLNG